MSVQQTARSGSKAAARLLAWKTNVQVASMAEKLDQQRLLEESRANEVVDTLSEAAQQTPRRQEVVKSFAFHLGANLQVPTADKRQTHTVESPTELADASNPFAGLPFQAWAERMGDRIMPAYDLIKEEQKKAKLAAKKAEPQPMNIPQVPHLLPFTRWAAHSRTFQETLIAEDSKTRRKARLSWYHPDDTMVPRDWFKGGLLADLKYYSPFSSKSAMQEA